MPEEDFATRGKYFIPWGKKIIRQQERKKMNELMEWNVFIRHPIKITHIIHSSVRIG